MNIVHVVESLEIGGLEHVVLALATAQRQRGHDVRIVCLWRLGPLAQPAIDAGIRVDGAGKRSGLDVAALMRLRRTVRSAHADVLHSHNPMAHYYAVAASLGLGIRCVLNTRHGMGSANPAARTERLYRVALHATDHAVSVCHAAQRRFVDNGVIPAAKAVVIPNGIALDRFAVRTDAAAARLRTQLALPPDTLLFGTVGRLNEAKQQCLLLRALRRLRDDGVDAALVIVGDGELRTALCDERDRLGLGDSVRLLGARNDVPDLLAALDAFVLSSRTEGYSLALVEASAAGLPLVATDVGGNREIVADGVSGLVVPAADVEALAEAMKSLAGGASRRSALGREARSWALREASLETMLDRYMALYERNAAVRRTGAHPKAAAQGETGRP